MSERRLVLMRHAHAGQQAGTPDHDRVLSGRGRREASAMGAWLAPRADVDLLIASSASRTRQTAERVLAALSGHGSSSEEAPAIAVDRALYQADAEDMLEIVRAADDGVGTLMIVGHQPTIEDFTRLLLDADPRHGFPPGTVVLLDIAGTWAETGPGAAALRSITAPGEI